MTNAALSAIRDLANMMTIDSSSLRDRAHAQVAQYPQYTRERFNGYIPVRVKRTIKTKMGEAFTKGEIVLAKIDSRHSYGVHAYMTAWSFSNKCDTSIKCADLEAVLRSE